MDLEDLGRIFSEVMVFEKRNFGNKDWVEGVSESQVGSFSQFFLKQKDQVYIRVSTKSSISQHLILA